MNTITATFNGPEENLKDMKVCAIRYESWVKQISPNQIQIGWIFEEDLLDVCVDTFHDECVNIAEVENWKCSMDNFTVYENQEVTKF